MNREMAEIIRNQKPLTLPPTANVQEACKHMHARKVGAILVTNPKGELVGIFTGRDAVRMVAEDKHAGTTLLREVMTEKPDCLPPRHTAIDALRLMRDGGFRHVPVVREGVVIGIVSRGDFRGLEQDRLDEETGIWERMRQRHPSGSPSLERHVTPNDSILTAGDLAAGLLVLESLKKRRSGVYQAVPAPPALLEALDLVHGIREVQSRRGRDGHPVLDVEPHDRLMVPSML